MNCWRIIDGAEEECPHEATFWVNDHGRSTAYCAEHLAEVTITASMRVRRIVDGERQPAEMYQSLPRDVEAWRTPVALKVRTPEGEVTASPGSWVLRSPDGDVWPIQDAIFHTRYAPVP